MHDLRSSVARSAIACGLGLALSLGGPAAAATTALAAGTGSVTISQQHNAGATYDAFQLFAADMSPEDYATHVAWSSDVMKSLVLQFLDGNGYGAWLTAEHPGAGQHDRPQNAAEYIAQMIGASPTDAGAATTPRTTQGRSFANRLARHLATNQALPHSTIKTGEKFTGSSGFWLVVTTDATSEANGEAGTAPIWLPLGGSTTEIDEKSSVPTVDKEVREDSTGAWGKTADANTNQDLSYRLTGSLPDNYDAFDFYHYKFTDTLSEGLTIPVPSGKTIADALTVKVGGKVAPVDGTNLKATYDKGILTVEFVDLKEACWSSFNINKSTIITVEYQTHMNPSRKVGSPGNPNTVYLTYTDDPITNHDGRTKEVPVKVFTYRLDLHKVDEQTNEPLKDAGFTIQVAPASSDQASRGLYVQADGSLASTAHEFFTNEGGSFSVSGLDEGTYLIDETVAPDGYELIDQPITFALTATRQDASRTLASLNATVSGGDNVDVNAASQTKVSAIDGNAGTVTINATNDRQIKLPITGLKGITGTSVASLSVIGATGAALLARRRRMP